MLKSILYLSFFFAFAMCGCDKKFHKKIFLHPVKKYNKFGLMDQHGNIVVPYIYDHIEEKAVQYESITKEFIITRDKKDGLLDSAGNVLFECEYDEIRDINRLYNKVVYGYYLANKGYKQYILSPKEKKAYQMETLKIRFHLDNGHFICYDSTDKFGLIKYDGTEVLPFKYEYIVPIRLNADKWIRQHKNGAQIDMSEDYLYIRQNGKEGITDQEGNIIIPTKYDDIHLFVNGKTTFIDGNEIGVIDSTGKVILKGDFESIDLVNYSLFYANYMHGLPTYYFGISYYKGLRFNLNNSKYPYRVEKDDKIEFIYDDNRRKTIKGFDKISIFKNDCLKVSKNGKCGLLDTNFKTIVPCIYDVIHNVNNKAFPAKFNGKWGIISIQNDEITPFIYDTIFFTEVYTSFLHYPPFAFKKGDYWAIGDDKNNILTDFIFTEIPRREGYFNNYIRTPFLSVKTKEGTGLIDTTGKTIIPPDTNFRNFDIYKDIIIVDSKKSNLVFDYSGNQLEFGDIQIWSEDFNGVFAVKDKDGVTHYYHDYRKANGEFIWKR